jgi:hypothetical protein
LCVGCPPPRREGLHARRGGLSGLRPGAQA